MSETGKFTHALGEYMDATLLEDSLVVINSKRFFF